MGANVPRPGASRPSAPPTRLRAPLPAPGIVPAMCAPPTLAGTGRSAGGRPARPANGRLRACRIGALLVASGALAASPVRGQEIGTVTGAWRSLSTRWFELHYPVAAEAWTRDLATRLDAIRDSVAARVGHAPPVRTTVVVSDPYNLPNGSAWPSLRQPAMLLYPTPPRPVDAIANHRGWGDKLASHEFAHLAHLTRPARRPQWWWLPLQDRASPIAIGTPRWAFEGYATHVEGAITGSGRPFGAWRAAQLRTLAREGRLPSYAALSAGGGYKGGSAAYLIGSAYWEWLVRLRGDSAMALVFRRQSARTARDFDEAFRGVFGVTPAEGYARFSAEATAQALRVESRVTAAGIVAGRRLVRLRGDPGPLAVSPSGMYLAYTLPARGSMPARVVVTRTDTAGAGDDARRVDSLARRDSARRAIAAARDPLDVPAIRTDAPPPRTVATLRARGGRSFQRPRFITDSLLLVESLVLHGDGMRRPSLFTWSLRSGRVTRVGDVSGTGDADPSPDGTRAAGVRCTGGICDVVLVTLDDGSTTPLGIGTLRRRWAQPRWHPDGRSLVAVASDDDGRWRLARITLGPLAPPLASRGSHGAAGSSSRAGADAGVDPTTMPAHDFDPRVQVAWLTPADDVDRHSPAWLPDGRTLAYVSEEGGIPEIETLDASGTRTRRTRVVTSAWSPAPLRGGALLLSVEHATGHDIMRLDALGSVTPIALGDSLVPVLPPPRRAAVALPGGPVSAATRYGAGPRHLRVLPQLLSGVDGGSVGLALVGTDPIGRLTWTAGALASVRGGWQGAQGAASWRAMRPSLRGEVAWLDLAADRQRDAARIGATRAGWHGASLGAVLPMPGDVVAQRFALSLSAGSLRDDSSWAQRVQLAASWNVGAVVATRTVLSASTAVAGGRTADRSWARAAARLALSWRGAGIALRGAMLTHDAPGSERFAIGGQAPPLVDELVLGQRIAQPLLPASTLTGREFWSARATLPALLLPGAFVFEGVAPSFGTRGLVRTVGWEGGVDTPRLDHVALPAFRLAGGVGVALDAPARRAVVAHLALRIAP